VPRLALLLLLSLAACRGAGSDPKCDEARRLYIQHQRTAVDQALPAIPREQRADFTARADAEIHTSEVQFIAACRDMDAGQLLACLRSPRSMDSPACEPVAAELKRRMSP
jgi:hypothetical protein